MSVFTSIEYYGYTSSWFSKWSVYIGHIHGLFTVISLFPHQAGPFPVVLDNCNGLQQHLQKRPAEARRAQFPAVSCHDTLIDLFCVLLSSSRALKQRHCACEKTQITIFRHTVSSRKARESAKVLELLFLLGTNLWSKVIKDATALCSVFNLWFSLSGDAPSFGTHTCTLCQQDHGNLTVRSNGFYKVMSG